MKILDIKLRRELWRSKGMFLSIVAILAIGVSGFVGMLATFQNLEVARLDYYAECRMGDFWVDLEKAPVQDLRERLELDGIAEIRPRIVFPARVEGMGSQKPIRGIAVSLPDEPHAVLSGALIQEGSWFTGGRRNEVIVNRAFAKAHSLSPGRHLRLVLQGRIEEFRIVGIALSSEYVYVTPPGDMAPDPAGYGIFFLPQSQAEEIFDFAGACNSVVGTFVTGVEDGGRPLLEAMTDRLSDYGVYAAYGREDQASHLALSSEMRQLENFATILPLIFFAVATMIQNVLMLRTVQRERTIIGTLEALGFSRRELMLHYIEHGLVLGLLGGVLGCLLGQWIAASMTQMYRGFFEFPRLVVRVYPWMLLVAVGVAVVFSVLGSLQGLRSLRRLGPAEAMRPGGPEAFTRTWMESFPRLWSRLSSGWRMVLRNLMRHKMRSAVAMAAATLGGSLVVTGLGFVDIMDSMLEFQFDKVLVSDYSLGLRKEAGAWAVDEVRRLPGVMHAEPSFTVACKFSHGVHERRGAIIGIAPEARLTVPHDAEGRAVPVPARGLLMTARLAERLHVQAGDPIVFRPIKGRQERIETHVAQIVESRIGLAVYADYDYLNRLVGEKGAVTEIQVQTQHDKRTRARFYQEVSRRPGIQAMTSTGAIKRRIESEFFDMLYAFLFVIVAFAGAIFFGSVLNSSLISMNERRREIATLRAIGWQDHEVTRLFLREAMVLNLLGALPGLLLGRLLMALMAHAFQNDLFSMPSEISTPTYLWTLVLTFVFVLAAHGFVRRQIHKLSWIAELGARE